MPQLKTDTEEELRKLIDKVFQYLFRVALFQVSMGATSVISGVMTLHVSRDRMAFPIAAAVPIWNGTLVLITGALGMYISKGEKTLQSSSVKCSFIGYFTICNITITTSLLTTVYGAGCIAHCVSTSSCEPDHSATLSFSALNIVLGILLVVCQIFGTCMFCRKGNKKKKKSIDMHELTGTTNAQTQFLEK
ncbi:unnamed protein product [Owenia fusiformis]|uniref:Uncharacterized protein n=1 Tax=Owenia fusiformis TaxID=6347 RepID=A0A8J1UGX3_OWEFU|nr:unnamed protein product [Owenia fusiformis]